MTMRSLIGFACAALSIAAVAAQEIPRFKGGVDVVQFTVTVLDKERHPVPGLAAADFDVLVDGKPRPLAAFAAVTLPGAAAEVVTSVAPDVQTNQVSPEGRLVVIVMDRSIANGESMQAAHAIANAAIDRLGPLDLGAVVYTDFGLRAYSQGLTADRARLRASAAETFVGALEAPAPFPSVAEAAANRGNMPARREAGRVQLGNDFVSGECRCGVCVPDTLTALAKALTGGMARHKSILFIGSTLSLTSSDTAGYCAAFIYPARDKLTRALDAANVTFHVIDPRPLEPDPSNILRQEILRILPDYTGGRLVVNSNRPEEKVESIFDEDRSYYVLAIARDPAVSKDDDRHQIKIAVKRPDVTVRTRALYFAADPKAREKSPPNTAAGAIAELLPRADFPLQMNLVTQFLPDGSSDVRVLLGVASGSAGKLDVLIRAYDRVFTPVGTPLKQRLDVPPAAVTGSAAFQWTSALRLPPGDYEVRAAVATADGARAASVIGYVDVPDVSKADVALSGIVVKSAGAPTIKRVFAPGEPVVISFQVARAKKAAADVEVTYRLTSELNQTLAGGVVPRPAAGTGAIDPHDLAIRMPGAAGQYVLRIAAGDGRHSAHRDVPLTVR
jgi:VWFA-related protein